MKLKKISKFALVGGFGFILAGGMSGCSSENNSEISQNKGAFVIIEETQPGKYKIKEEFPASENRVVLKKLDGTEKVLTKEEMDELIAQENAQNSRAKSGKSGFFGKNSDSSDSVGA